MKAWRTISSKVLSIKLLSITHLVLELLEVFESFSVEFKLLELVQDFAISDEPRSFTDLQKQDCLG